MIQFVEKRETHKNNEPKVVDFDILRIRNAVQKAFEEVCRRENLSKDARKEVERYEENSEGVLDGVSQKVRRKLNGLNKQVVSVEQIQDIVEKVLLAEKYAEIAKAYILYRNERSKIRNAKSRLIRVIDEITFADAKDANIKRDNANVDGNTAMGTMLQYGSAISKEFCKDFVIHPDHAYAHENGDIHIHDLDFLNMGTLTCAQIDLDKLFANGFSTGHGFLREPNDIMSYTALTAIAIQANQNDQHGGQSVPAIDFHLAKGVLKTFRKKVKDNLQKYLEIKFGVTSPEVVDAVLSSLGEISSIVFSEWDKKRFEQALLKNVSDKISENLAEQTVQFVLERAFKETDRQTYQAMEGLIHNLNTMHSRAGAQVPFSSINFGTDISPEGRLVSKNLMLAQEAGLGRGETAIFPITIFKCKKGINFEKNDPNYDLFKLACRVSAKRLFPNFSFLDSSFNAPYYQKGKPETEVTYMGCRTRVMGNVNGEEVAFGRGNISFTTINLPRLGIKHGIVNGRETADIQGFFEELDAKFNLVVNQLLERYEIQIKKKVKNFPFLMGQGVWKGSENLKPNDTLEEVVKHGSLTVGFIGLAETLTALLGKHHGESAEAQVLGLRIIEHLRKRIDEATVKYHLNFALIATPAEGLAGRFTKIDKKIYGEIPGITDKGYYTNSYHIPVSFPITAFNKIQLEGGYHKYCNGGHISYVELDGDTTKNVDAFEAIIRAMAEADMGYGSVNHPVDRDPVCGFTGVIDDVCPMCGRTEENVPFDRIRRITGYLVGTLDRFNDGKAEEEKDRIKHGLK